MAAVPPTSSPPAARLRQAWRARVLAPALCARWRRRRDYDPAGSWLIASAPRGGSTWLAQVLSAGPERLLVWEPFSPHNGVAPAHGFGWNTVLAAGATAPAQRAYAAGVLDGQGLVPALLARPALRTAQLWRSERLVVKCVRANGLLPWLAGWSPAPILWLLRHPCAVVASQLRHRDWDVVTPASVELPPALAAAWPHLRDVHAGLGDRVAALAFEWACQHLVPLATPRPWPWRTVVYEDLVADAAAGQAQLAAALGEPLPPGAAAAWAAPSATARAGSTVLSGRDPAAGWRQELDAAQIERVLAVVAAVGVQGVTAAPGLRVASLTAPAPVRPLGA